MRCIYKSASANLWFYLDLRRTSCTPPYGPMSLHDISWISVCSRIQHNYMIPSMILGPFIFVKCINNQTLSSMQKWPIRSISLWHSFDNSRPFYFNAIHKQPGCWLGAEIHKSAAADLWFYLVGVRGFTPYILYVALWANAVARHCSKSFGNCSCVALPPVSLQSSRRFCEPLFRFQSILPALFSVASVTL